jgi:ATP synthase protein I
VAADRSVPNHPAAGKTGQGAGWDDEDDAQAPFKPLTREEAQALRESEPPVSPWRVVLMQGAVGAVVALLVALNAGRTEAGWSALYGAAAVVVPGALMARGMTSALSRLSPAASAVSVMLWEMVKIAATVAMLLAAPKVIQPLVWPALLVGLVAGLSVYWFALLWRGRNKKI